MGGAGTENFYESLKPMDASANIFDPRHYVRAPGSWCVAVSDIKGSTAAVAEGRHSDINFSAAAMIAALTNFCGSLPYQFGGDGAVALIPPEYENDARRILARVRKFARDNFRLDLRIGLVSVQTLRTYSTDILVGRYEPSPGNAYAVFLGGGMEILEQAVKQRGDPRLHRQSIVDESEDDGEPPDLEGLSCRWTPLKSSQGRMVSLVVRCTEHGEIHNALCRLVGVESLKAASLDILKTRWPPKGLVREARARRGKGLLWLWIAKVGIDTLVAFLVFRLKLHLGAFDPEQYRCEIAENAVDFARSDDVLALTFDCPTDRLELVRSYLEERSNRSELDYGLHESDHAIMTCLVASITDNQHVHFVDGGDGGYTKAATQLKARLKAADQVARGEF